MSKVLLMLPIIESHVKKTVSLYIETQQHNMKYFGILILAIVLMSTSQHAGLSFYEKRSGNDKIIVCNNNSDKKFEVTLNFSCTGHSTSRTSPLKQIIEPYNEQELVTLTPIEGVSGSCQMGYTYTEIRSSRAKESMGYGYNGIVVYGKNNCPRCDYFIDALYKKGTTFRELNIDLFEADNDLMWEQLEKHGYYSQRITTPVVSANGQLYYNIDDLDAVLGAL